MAKTMKKKPVKRYYVQSELAKIDQLFRKLERDRSLPTFAEHFMYCLVLGISEHVNLKKLYPKTHEQLATWLNEHNRTVVSGTKLGKTS